MFNDIFIAREADELDRHAYNAAFHELGFRWHWDIDTHEALLASHGSAAERIGHYLQTSQPHLLKAYDRVFLIELIERKKAEQLAALARRTSRALQFDWACMPGCEIGA